MQSKLSPDLNFSKLKAKQNQTKNGSPSSVRTICFLKGLVQYPFLAAT